MPAKMDLSKTVNFIVEELTKLINQKHDELTNRIDNRLRKITEYVKKVENLAQDALILGNKNKTLIQTNEDKIESLDMTIGKIQVDSDEFIKNQADVIQTLNSRMHELQDRTLVIIFKTTQN